MGFQIFEPVFAKFDAATAIYVSDFSSRLIAALTPVVSTGLTLGFIVFAMAIIRGAVDMPISDFLWRSFRIGVITSIAMAGGLYQTQIADAILTTPNALASFLISSGSNNSTIGAVLDQTAAKAIDVAATGWEHAAFFSQSGLVYLAYSVLIVIATVTLMSIGGAFIILAKIALGMLAGLGPLFIFALLWQPTSRLFESWVSQILNYGILILLTSTIFLFIMGLYGSYMEGANLDGVQNAVYTLTGALFLTATSAILLLQLPSIASGLAGGVSLGYMWELRSLRSGVGSVGKSDTKTGKRSGRSGALGGADIALRGSAKAGKMTASAAKKVMGFARGRTPGHS